MIYSGKENYLKEEKNIYKKVCFIHLLNFFKEKSVGYMRCVGKFNKIRKNLFNSPNIYFS